MAWILDVIFFLLLLVGCLIGAKIGFVKGVCKIAGWFLSILIPFLFCAAFKDALENWFGMVSAISNGVHSAMLGGWLSMAISFVSLFLIVRLGTWLLGFLGTLLANSVKAIAVINTLLDGLLGMPEAFFLCYFLLLIMSWIAIPSCDAFINSSTVVGAIYRSGLMGLLPH